MTRYSPANPYTYECSALDRLAQLAGATGDPDEGYPDGGEAVGLGAVDLDAVGAMYAALPADDRRTVSREIRRRHAASR